MHTFTSFFGFAAAILEREERLVFIANPSEPRRGPDTGKEEKEEDEKREKKEFTKDDLDTLEEFILGDEEIKKWVDSTIDEAEGLAKSHVEKLLNLSKRHLENLNGSMLEASEEDKKNLSEEIKKTEEEIKKLEQKFKSFDKPDDPKEGAGKSSEKEKGVSEKFKTFMDGLKSGLVAKINEGGIKKVEDLKSFVKQHIEQIGAKDPEAAKQATEMIAAIDELIAAVRNSPENAKEQLEKVANLTGTKVKDLLPILNQHPYVTMQGGRMHMTPEGAVQSFETSQEAVSDSEFALIKQALENSFIRTVKEYAKQIDEPESTARQLDVSMVGMQGFALKEEYADIADLKEATPNMFTRIDEFTMLMHAVNLVMLGYNIINARMNSKASGGQKEGGPEIPELKGFIQLAEKQIEQRSDVKDATLSTGPEGTVSMKLETNNEEEAKALYEKIAGVLGGEVVVSTTSTTVETGNMTQAQVKSLLTELRVKEGSEEAKEEDEKPKTADEYTEMFGEIPFGDEYDISGVGVENGTEAEAFTVTFVTSKANEVETLMHEDSLGDALSLDGYKTMISEDGGEMIMENISSKQVQILYEHFKKSENTESEEDSETEKIIKKFTTDLEKETYKTKHDFSKVIVSKSGDNFTVIFDTKAGSFESDMYDAIDDLREDGTQTEATETKVTIKNITAEQVKKISDYFAKEESST